MQNVSFPAFNTIVFYLVLQSVYNDTKMCPRILKHFELSLSSTAFTQQQESKLSGLMLKQCFQESKEWQNTMDREFISQAKQMHVEQFFSSRCRVFVSRVIGRQQMCLCTGSQLHPHYKQPDILQYAGRRLQKSKNDCFHH